MESQITPDADPQSTIADALETLDITREHSKQALAETDYWLANDGLDDEALVDLTSLPFITMDNEDSRDLDQALLIEQPADSLADSSSASSSDSLPDPSSSKGYRVRYALADASYYIRPGSALFSESLQRGTTYYTPLLAVPMLPTALSEGLISLNPGVTRRALVFDIYLDNNAEVLKCEVVKAKIKSQAKLSYSGVQNMLDNKNAATSEVKPYDNSLKLLQQLGNKLIANSEQRGVIRFNRVETIISARQDPPDSPPRFHAALRTRYDTERYNEQISLLCNMQGAELLLALSGVSDVVQAVYRVHEAPLRKNLSRLKQILEDFAKLLPDADSPDSRWRWQAGQSLADFVAGLPADKQYERKVKVIQRQIMQAQRSSEFMPEPGEHHALKASSYARFSSPMREVVGIFTHKELLEALSGQLFDNDADEALRTDVIDAANSSRQRQRQLDKVIALAALQSHFLYDLQRVEHHSEKPQWHTGTIMGLRSDKLYISLDNLAMDVKIYKDDLNKQYSVNYEFTDTVAHSNEPLVDEPSAPSWRLGQGVKLQIQSFDSSRRRLVFAMKPINPD